MFRRKIKIRKLMVGVVFAALFFSGLIVAQTKPFGSDTFDDIPAGHWADEAIGWAAETGITEGCGETMFCPDGELTRAQMVTLLYRYHTEVATLVADPLRQDSNGDGRLTCAEVGEPVTIGDPRYRFMDDRDGDGRVC